MASKTIRGIKVTTERRDAYVGTTKLHVGTRYRFSMYDPDLAEHYEVEGAMEGIKTAGVTSAWIMVTEPGRMLWRGNILSVEEIGG